MSRAQGVHTPVPQFPCPMQGSSGPCCRDSCVPCLGVQCHGSCPRHDVEELISILLATPKTKEQGELAQTFASLPLAWLYPGSFPSRSAGSHLPHPTLGAPVPITGSNQPGHFASPLCWLAPFIFFLFHCCWDCYSVIPFKIIDLPQSPQ